MKPELGRAALRSSSQWLEQREEPEQQRREIPALCLSIFDMIAPKMLIKRSYFPAFSSRINSKDCQWAKGSQPRTSPEPAPLADYAPFLNLAASSEPFVASPAL
jgi:hypothetical protein